MKSKAKSPVDTSLPLMSGDGSGKKKEGARLTNTFVDPVPLNVGAIDMPGFGGAKELRAKFTPVP
jgi:hypothetical protein